MKGEYYRYKADFTADEERKESTHKSLEGYQQSFHISCNHMSPANPIRLGSALSWSVFYYEILNEQSKACELAKKAFDEALGQLDDLSEDSYKDSTVIMQLLRDNIILWTQSGDDGIVNIC